jgi:hypothetical protein
LSLLAQSSDDWNCLLAITALQALGRGTPNNCDKRNRLLIKGMKAPFDFNFPQRLHEETNTDDFRSDLSEIIGETFFQDADHQWPTPQLVRTIE